MKTYECPYCDKLHDEPNAQCCGEAGHVNLVNEAQRLSVIFSEANAFAHFHSIELANELVELNSTGILRDGKLRELGVICDQLRYDGLGTAKSLATHAILEEHAKS